MTNPIVKMAAITAIAAIERGDLTWSEARDTLSAAALMEAKETLIAIRKRAKEQARTNPLSLNFRSVK